MSFFSLHKVKNLKRKINKVFFIKFFKKPLCNLTRGTHEMGKFKTVNELVNSLKPDYPVYCIRLNEIKKIRKIF